MLLKMAVILTITYGTRACWVGANGWKTLPNRFDMACVLLGFSCGIAALIVAFFGGPEWLIS